MGWLQWGGSGPDLQLFLSLASIWKWLCLHSLNPAKWSSGVQYIGEREWMVNAGKVEIDRWRQAASVRLQLREGVQRKTVFWEIFPKCGWVGCLIPKQGPNPSKPPQITPKIAFFSPKLHFFRIFEYGNFFFFKDLFNSKGIPWTDIHFDEISYYVWDLDYKFQIARGTQSQLNGIF